MGHFHTKCGLLLDGNMKNSFQRARLLSGPSDHEIVLRILKKYILEQLVFMPGGSEKFDRYMMSAYNALRQVIMGEDMPIDCLPPSLYTKLQHDVSEQVRKHVHNMQRSVLETTLTDLKQKGFTTMPSMELLPDQCTVQQDVVWNGDDICQGLTQSELSFEE
jgi:hypothetical protein